MVKNMKTEGTDLTEYAELAGSYSREIRIS